MYIRFFRKNTIATNTYENNLANIWGTDSMIRFLLLSLLSLLFILNAQADIYSASSALSRGDYETAIAEFTELAENGDASAQANLGYMYYAGEGVPQDYEKAVFWYRKSAVQGNKDAQYNLAVSYAFGEGVKQDLTEAAIWYRRAGEQNHVVSQYSLGISYAYGEGVPQDQKEAARWFKKAADQGYARAQVHLGSMYHTGEGVEQNYSEAVRWYRMAADRGDATAQYNLGTMYRSGKGVEQNYAQAKRWFRQSADQGYAAAQNELASLERSAASNIATRTVQAKPEITPAKETLPDSAPTKKVEPVEEKIVEQMPAPKEPVQTITETSETKKKPLFSVEKENLLSLDDSELDIPEPESEAKEEVVTQIKEPVPVETKTEEQHVTAIEEPETEPVSAMHNALGIPAPTSTSDEEPESSSESSKGFFSKLFSKKESPEPESSYSDEETIDATPAVEPDTEEIVADVDEEELEISQSSSDTSAIHNALGIPAPTSTSDEEPETEAKEEVVTQIKEPVPVETKTEEQHVTAIEEPETEPVSAMHNALGIPAPTSTADEDPESSSESSKGFFSKLFSKKESPEPESSYSDEETIDETPAVEPDTKEVVADIAEPETAIDTELKEDVVTQIKEPVPVETKTEEQHVTAIEEPETEPVSAMHNALGIPAPTSTADEDPESSSESSKGFFSKLFSKKESPEPESSYSDEETIDETPAVEPDTEEVVADIAEPETEEQNVTTIEEPETEPVSAMHNALGIPAPTSTADEEPESSSESSKGFFSKLFSKKETPESETSITETDEQLIAKVDEPTPVAEEIKLAQEAEVDLSHYSISAGRRALTNNNYEEAVKQFRPLAEAGDSEAQSHLGSLYYVGKGVPQSFDDAYNWYKKSADQGNVDAQYSIGNMYLLGEGVEQNNSSAAKWYAMASEQGHTAAKNNLNNLKKLEQLNRENQLKQEALESKIAEEESKPDVIDESEAIAATPTNEETIDSNIETNIEEDKKPGLLGFLGGLFGGKSKEEAAEEIETSSVDDQTTFTEEAVDIETKQQETTINTYAAGEGPSSEALQTVPEAEENIVEDNQLISDFPETESLTEVPSETNTIASMENDAARNTQSPDFFQNLFGNNEPTNKNQVDDGVELKQTEEIETVNQTNEDIALNEASDLEETTDESEAASPDVIDEVTEETEKKSGGFFGYIGNIFSSKDKNPSENIAPEADEDIAMLEPETDQISINSETSTDNNIEEAPAKTESEKLRSLAVQGDQDAQYKLGALYYAGDGVKQDYSEAALWYRRAAQQGNVDAQYSLGNMYLMGEGVNQDDSQAANWYALAADQGHGSAKHNLSNLQKTMIVQPTAEIENNTISNEQLISLDNAVETSSEIDTSGKAEYEQGLAYAFGDGVPQNDRTAFNLFYESAEKGYVLGQYKVGVAFAYGEGVRQDQKLAAEWYRKAAEQGYTIAQRNLASMYLDGNGVEKNKIQAHAWYQLVANSGNAMDLRRRDMLEKEMTDTELSESKALANQISSRIKSNPAL
jgi:TPR repeat protein